MLYLGTFGLQFENNIVIFEINTLEFVYLQTFAEKKAKMLKFGIKNALFGYFWLEIVIFEISSNLSKLSF